MIPIPSGVRVWIATGHTDMRRGMQGLALQVQEQLKRDPHVGDFIFFAGAAAIWRKCFGTTGSDFHSTQSDSTEESSSGPRRKRASCRFRRRRWRTCWKESTGAIPNSPGDRRARDESAGRARWLIAGRP